MCKCSVKTCLDSILCPFFIFCLLFACSHSAAMWSSFAFMHGFQHFITYISCYIVVYLYLTSFYVLWSLSEPRFCFKGCGFGSWRTSWNRYSWKWFASYLASWALRNHPSRTINWLLIDLFTWLCFYLVTQEQLDRAKQGTRSAVLMNLESRVCIPNS